MCRIYAQTREAAVTSLKFTVFWSDCWLNVTKTFNYEEKTKIWIFMNNLQNCNASKISKIRSKTNTHSQSISVCDFWFNVNLTVNRIFDIRTIPESFNT